MKLNKPTKILCLCGVFLSIYSAQVFSWSCDSDCNIRGAFGIPDVVSKTSCEAYKGLKCGIKIPTPKDVINDTLNTIKSLANIGCAITFETYVGGVYNACINGSDGFSDIANAPRNVQLAAAILNDLGVYSRQEFNSVKIMWCNTISVGANGIVPAPERILLIRDYRDKPPYNDAYAYPGGITSILAHEMTHIQQIRNRGFENFSCNYSTEMLKHGGTGEGNSFEKEAYDRQRYVDSLLLTYKQTVSDDLLINYFLNPPVLTPHTPAEINSALSVINQMLLDDN